MLQLHDRLKLDEREGKGRRWREDVEDRKVVAKIWEAKERGGKVIEMGVSRGFNKDVKIIKREEGGGRGGGEK